jgi:hypothetical protein
MLLLNRLARKQFIMKVTLVFAMLSVAAFSCRQRHLDEQITAINKNLEQANAFITDQNKSVYTSLHKLAYDPVSSSVATVWAVCANQVSIRSSGVNAYIDSLKKVISAFKKEGTETANLFTGIGLELYNRLVQFSQEMSHVLPAGSFAENISFKKQLEKDNSLFKKEIATRFGLLEADTTPAFIDASTWMGRYLSKSNREQGIVMLSKLQNDLLLAESSLVEYCKNTIARDALLFDYDVPHAMTLLSCTHVKAGQPIELTAGIGMFSEASKPAIMIDGKEYRLREDHLVNYRFIATGKPGNYFLPVRIGYNKQDGSYAYFDQQLEYTIVQ